MSVTHRAILILARTTGARHEPLLLQVPIIEAGCHPELSYKSCWEKWMQPGSATIRYLNYVLAQVPIKVSGELIKFQRVYSQICMAGDLYLTSDESPDKWLGVSNSFVWFHFGTERSMGVTFYQHIELPVQSPTHDMTDEPSALTVVVHTEGHMNRCEFCHEKDCTCEGLAASAPEVDARIVVGIEPNASEQEPLPVWSRNREMTKMHGLLFDEGLELTAAQDAALTKLTPSVVNLVCHVQPQWAFTALIWNFLLIFPVVYTSVWLSVGETSDSRQISLLWLLHDAGLLLYYATGPRLMTTWLSHTGNSWTENCKKDIIRSWPVWLLWTLQVLLTLLPIITAEVTMIKLDFIDSDENRHSLFTASVSMFLCCCYM